MRFSSLGLMAGLAASAIAEDVLFVDNFEYEEYAEATGTLGLTAKVVTEEEWRGMKTADFAAFKAIVLADPNCSNDPSILNFLTETKDVWGPAVQGNIVLIGTDPTFHFSAEPGAKTLIDNAIGFSVAGKSLAGASQTGLYFALSCYYHSVDSSPVEALSYFGEFAVRGNLDCYNNAHIVASSPALGTLDDAALSNWDCSVHEAFSVYPTEGINGFQALAIAKDIIGDGSKTFDGGVVGLPYIISRGATPDGCGNGKWDKDLGEECDDGNIVDGDGCSKSCKCESGRPTGDGHCFPKLEGNTTAPYANTTTVTATVTTTATEFPPYVTPSLPTGPKIIGVEIIVYVTIIEDCKTIGGSTVTSYITSACSTVHKPIWDVKTPGYPCYVCEGVPTSKFITASVTTCTAPPPTWVPEPPVILPCHTCSPITLATCPVYSTLASSKVYEIPAPTVKKHEHSQVTTIAATTVAVKTSAAVTASVSATSTYVAFTGAANQIGGTGTAMAILGGVLGAIMLVL